MPYFNASRQEECIVETIDVLSMLETVIEDHPNHLIVVEGDLNTELKGDSPFDSNWNEFALCIQELISVLSFIFLTNGLHISSRDSRTQKTN